MIHWLTQTAAAHPDLGRAFPPPGLLNPAELACFDTLRTEKRRRDWLLGRWTAKHLVQAFIQNLTGESLPMADLTVVSTADGAPAILLKGQRAFSLSISHSRACAFCAVVKETDRALGADIETIETRSSAFVRDYFTDIETELIRRVPTVLEDTWITATWSAKEAALKALHLGLKADTRSVSCSIEPMVDAPENWTPFQIGCGLPEAPHLLGWWRIQSGYVLTLAVET